MRDLAPNSVTVKPGAVVLTTRAVAGVPSATQGVVRRFMPSHVESLFSGKSVDVGYVAVDFVDNRNERLASWTCVPPVLGWAMMIYHARATGDAMRYPEGIELSVTGTDEGSPRCRQSCASWPNGYETSPHSGTTFRRNTVTIDGRAGIKWNRSNSGCTVLVATICSSLSTWHAAGTRADPAEMKATASPFAVAWFGPAGEATASWASERLPDKTVWFCAEDVAAALTDALVLSGRLAVPSPGDSRARFLPFERPARAAGVVPISSAVEEPLCTKV